MEDGGGRSVVPDDTLITLPETLERFLRQSARIYG
jgi:hypothetical protein